MKHQLSALEKFQSEYFKHQDRKKIFYFTKLLWLCKVMDKDIFGKQHNREYVIGYNRLYQQYLIAVKLKDNNQALELLQKMIFKTEVDYPYVVEFRKRLDEYLEEKGIDTSFDEIRWSPLTIGVEVIE